MRSLQIGAVFDSRRVAINRTRLQWSLRAHIWQCAFTWTPVATFACQNPCLCRASCGGRQFRVGHLRRRGSLLVRMGPSPSCPRVTLWGEGRVEASAKRNALGWEGGDGGWRGRGYFAALLRTVTSPLLLFLLLALPCPGTTFAGVCRARLISSRASFRAARRTRRAESVPRAARQLIASFLPSSASNCWLPSSCASTARCWQ